MLFGSPTHKKAPADRAGGLEDGITSGVYEDSSVSTGPAQAVRDLNPMHPKPSFASLDRVSLVPTAGSSAVRQGPAVSVALAGSAGFQVSAPSPASADRYVVGVARLTSDGREARNTYPQLLGIVEQLWLARSRFLSEQQPF